MTEWVIGVLTVNKSSWIVRHLHAFNHRNTKNENRSNQGKLDTPQEKMPRGHLG